MKVILARYLEFFPRETERLRGFSDFLRDTSDPRQLFHRKNFAGHITASGFVLSPDGKRLALVKHKTLNRHLQPGGHVEETDSNVLAAARREILEETGLANCLYFPLDSDPLLPLDIDTHEIPANPKKDEPKHWHHDFRYLFQAESEMAPGRHGECEWFWHPIERAIDEGSFKLVVEKLKKSTRR
jgi:8-oxo-dGTP pyrophosphatase MutT (NUDIX family)